MWGAKTPHVNVRNKLLVCLTYSTPYMFNTHSKRPRLSSLPTHYQNDGVLTILSLTKVMFCKRGGAQGTPGRTSDPLAVHIVPRLPRKRRGARGTPGRTSDPLAVHIVPRLPRKRRGARGTPGRTSDPLAVHIVPRLPRKRRGVHIVPRLPRKSGGARGTPGRTSDPLALHIVPRLPRKSGGAPRDARAYIRPLGSAHCRTPATQKRRSPKGRQGVHQTPWQYTLSHACHAKAAEPQGTPGRTSNPLAVQIVPRLPRKRGGAPRDARAYIRPLGSADCPTPATQKRRSPKGRQGVHPTPWQCRLSHACHAKDAEPEGRQGVHQTPWQCTLSHACHAKAAEPQGTPGRTSDPLAVHIVARLPHKRGGAPRDARAYIRPLGSAHCPTPATQNRRSPKGRQGVHPTPWQYTLSHACHAKEAEPQGTPGRTSDPLALHIVARLPRKRGGAPRDARAYIRPLGTAHCPTPATQKRRSPKGRQGVHPTPWQCRLSHACHAKAAEPQGTPGRTSDPLAVHIVPRLPRKSGGAPRDARAYIQPLGSADCPTPATQKRRSPKGRQGVHPTPWQCTLSHACHAKCT